jgi:uncharacterized membrane protein YphA (DoxX/SURF4 family)
MRASPSITRPSRPQGKPVREIASGKLKAGCAALDLGFLTREFALLLVLFNLSAAAIGHPYWSIDGDANARWAQFIGFWKDIGLAGGALFLLARVRAV